MHAAQRGIQVAVIGWAGVIAFALLMAVSGDLAPALVFAAVASGLILWLVRTGGRVALWVSLATGGLFALQHAAYSVADVGSSLLLLAGDAFGLAAGVAIVVGSAMGLLEVRRARACC